MIRRVGVIACLAAGLSACGGASSSGPSGTIAVSGGGAYETIALVSPMANSTRNIAATVDQTLDADLAPDGQHIAIAGVKGLWVTNRDGSHARLIVDEKGLDVVAGAVAWSPDGRDLAFIRDGSLYTVPSRGGAVTFVTRNADSPTWSSDGAEIIFVRNPDQSSRNGTISAIRADGRGLRRLIAGKWFGPAVSPDGSKIAFYRNGVYGIYVAHATGGMPRLVTRKGFQPKWSPNGRYLAFLRDVNCGEAVCSSRTFVMPASGGAARAYGPVIGDMALLSWSR